MYEDRANKTQGQLNAATTALDDALTIFQGQIIKGGDPTSLTTGIMEATNLYTNAVEGVEIGQHIVGSKMILQGAIDVAQSVVDNAENQTAQQLAEATAALDLAVLTFENSKVIALAGLTNLTITGTGTDTSNHIPLENNETLALASSDLTNAVATVTIDPTGTVQVTGVAAGGPITITAQVKKEGQVIKTGTFTVMVVPMGITSKTIANFDFSTANATTAQLVSKPVTEGDFTGKRKDFTININGESIPIYVDWKLSTEFPKGAAMGGVVESHIQDYYSKTGRLMTRPLTAYGFGETFQITAFQPGSASSFTLEGTDWEYFFEQSSAQGTDEDSSRNRTFSISDETHTATILLNRNIGDMSGLVKRINQQLTTQQVDVLAEKVSETTFKLIGINSNTTIHLDGVDKSEFFN